MYKCISFHQFFLIFVSNISSILIIFYRQVCKNCKCPKEDHNSPLHSGGVTGSAAADPLAAATSAVMAAQQQLQQQQQQNPNQLNSSIDSSQNCKTSAGSTSTTTSNGGQGAPKPTQAHSDDDSGCALEEYTWVPPGLKPDQVRQILLLSG